MSRVLLSFLGKTNQGQGAAGYRRARYRFPDGTVRETTLFGLALREQIQPDRLVLCGTSGSMWDVLIEHWSHGSTGETERLAHGTRATQYDVQVALSAEAILRHRLEAIFRELFDEVS